MLYVIRAGLALYLKLFFLLTPFFVLGTFISLTDGIPQTLRTKLAIRITLGASCVTLIIFLVGFFIMRVFGITVDAFRAGRTSCWTWRWFPWPLPLQPVLPLWVP